MIAQDQVPLILGGGVVVIILVAFFTSRGGNGGNPRSAPLSSEPSKARKKKNKKKGKSGKSNSGGAPASRTREVPAEEEPAAEEAVPADSDPEPSVAKKKKKKKKKKKPSANSGAGDSAKERRVSFAGDGSEDSDDDDFDLTAIQSANARRGANDAAKRAAANKERERQKALKKQEERERAEAEARAAAEAEARAAAEAAAAAEAERIRLEEDAAAAAAVAAAEAEEKARLEAAQKAKEAVANGDAPVPGGKKKRKRKKKKSAAAAVAASEETAASQPTPPPQEAPRSLPVLADQPADEERWEVVPQEEEWQEVGHKKAKQKAKMEAQAAAELELAGDEDDLGAFVSDDAGAAEERDVSATLPAGDDPLLFIGKGGATIQALQDTTGAHFSLDRQSNVLTISGPADCVELGLSEARSILAAEAERLANQVEETVTWGPDAIKAAIGRGGQNIRAAQDDTGARIDADVEAGTLTVSGPSDAVQAALTLCHNAAFGEVQDRLELGSRNAVNVVYGPGFSTVRALQDETGCRLDIDRGTTTLKLAGSSEAVAEATERVRALLEENRGFEMTIENSKVGAVYGRSGETLRSVQDRTGTHIDVSRGPTHATVSIMGKPDDAARARGMLQRAVDGEVELKPGEVAEEVELGSGTAAVIGRGGANVADLESRHDVKVNVRSELQTAKIVGLPEGVAAAAEEIRGIVGPILEAERAQREANEVMASGESAWQVTDEDDDADGW